jgi:hypothetical protein
MSCFNNGGYIIGIDNMFHIVSDGWCDPRNTTCVTTTICQLIQNPKAAAACYYPIDPGDTISENDKFCGNEAFYLIIIVLLLFLSLILGSLLFYYKRAFDKQETTYNITNNN